MAGIGLVSPGVKVREVDLTVGRIDSISDQTGAIVGPFERGPVLEPLLIENEQDMIDLFGKPKNNDQKSGKYNFINLLGYHECNRKLSKIILDAKNDIRGFKNKNKNLLDFTDYVEKREN